MNFKYVGFAALVVATLSTLFVQNPLNAQELQNSSFQVQDAGRFIPNFGIVSPVLLRGGQPKTGGLAYLKDAGVKTIVNLRDGKKDIESEKRIANDLGLNYVSIPLSVLKTASKAQIKQFLAVVQKPENQPVFVHCRQGQDRCGTMVAAYRLSDQSWTANKAYSEMLKYGFHPIFFGLSSSIFSMAAELGRPEIQPNPFQEIKGQLKDMVSAL